MQGWVHPFWGEISNCLYRNTYFSTSMRIHPVNVYAMRRKYNSENLDHLNANTPNVSFSPQQVVPNERVRIEKKSMIYNREHLEILLYANTLNVLSQILMSWFCLMFCLADEEDKVRLVRVRNPWGDHNEWKVTWSRVFYMVVTYLWHGDYVTCLWHVRYMVVTTLSRVYDHPVR